jgi:hypothetical protein
MRIDTLQDSMDGREELIYVISGWIDCSCGLGDEFLGFVMVNILVSFKNNATGITYLLRYVVNL